MAVNSGNREKGQVFQASIAQFKQEGAHYEEMEKERGHNIDAIQQNLGAYAQVLSSV